MLKRDRQHFVSQAYLRNFSCDLEDYEKVKVRLSQNQRIKRKRRMRIHFYSFKNHSLGCRRIQKLATEDFYFPKPIDEEIQTIEQNLSLLPKIHNSKDASLLNSDETKRILWEIANCFQSRSRTFREQILRLPMQSERRYPPKLLEHFKDNPDLVQAMYFSKNPRQLLRKSWGVYKKKHQIEEKTIDPAKKAKVDQALSIIDNLSMLPKTFIPTLLENQTFLPFITGDDCVVGEIIMDKFSNPIPAFYFPISPQFAIRFMENPDFDEGLKQEISDPYVIFTLNRHLCDCSQFYLFANERRVLELLTLSL